MMGRRLRVDLRAGRGEERLDEFLAAVRAFRGRFVDAFGELRLRLDQTGHELAQGAQVATLLLHERAEARRHVAEKLAVILDEPAPQPVYTSDKNPRTKKLQMTS